MKRYDAKTIEAKWQERWDRDGTFRVDIKKAERPFFNLMMFPYPSGEGLHVGHVYAFGGADTFGRLKRMQGYNVFEPMGFDSFGIHSENYAIKVGKHPRELIQETTSYFRERQMKRLGALFDWDHEVITSQPNYYKWTQWLFIQLFKAGLAVRKKAPVDWCPSCKTVLADEQVIGGKCERCQSQVIEKELEQWFLKTTDYAEKLLSNLDKIDWSETTKTMQKNWIGKSEGLQIKFSLEVPRQEDKKHLVEVFTTRADTLFGATFVVVSPEVAKSWIDLGWKAPKEVADYITKSLKVDQQDRTAEKREKTGVFTEVFAINSGNKKEIPVWVADYVLGSYGTGAIMAVPAHDSRDYEFAKKYNLEIVEVIIGGDVSKEAYIGEGKLVNSGEFDGLDSKEGIKKISEYIEENQLGKRTVNYHLRDWLISRQRYWGPPIPMIFCDKCAKDGKSANKDMTGWFPVPEKDLPVELPYLKNYQPKGTGVSPLATVPEFLSVKCPECGSLAKRETDVSDTFLDSSWYFLRYPSTRSARSGQVPFDSDITKKWLPVDSYIGGNEHAVLHLLYARFITMALHDIGYLDFEEPFKKFRAHGLVIHEGAKMSKSRGNVVNPNEFMDSYGADTLRIYLLFLGPYEQGGDFSDRAIAGVYRFLNRVWSLVQEIADNTSTATPSLEMERALNLLIKKVGEDLENLKFNTAIAAMMEFLNMMNEKKDELNKELAKKFVLLLSPLAPHISEELWEVLGEKFSVHHQLWPSYKTKFLEEDKVTIVIQVNGRFRDKLEAPKGISKEDVARLALDRPKVKVYTKKGQIKKSIWIEGRLLNLVTGG
ncbi:MAG: leucine--tRNA ligase [Candidatus Woykebacteria bacterium]